MDQVLELKNIHYAYHNPDGETPAINGISFILNKGEFVAIVGPSGCGKSTLLSIIAGDRKSTRLNSSHRSQSRMPSSA